MCMHAVKLNGPFELGFWISVQRYVMYITITYIWNGECKSVNSKLAALETCGVLSSLFTVGRAYFVNDNWIILTRKITTTLIACSILLNAKNTKCWVFYITNEMQLTQCSLLLSALYMFLVVFCPSSGAYKTVCAALGIVMLSCCLPPHER